MKVVYHPGLTMGSAFLNRFHPFEFDRAERALAILRKTLGPEAEQLIIAPENPVELSRLGRVHDQAYLSALSKGSTIAGVIEHHSWPCLPRAGSNRGFSHRPGGVWPPRRP